jgi:acetyltransferase-like isoleucine patch superfamily enzyme
MKKIIYYIYFYLSKILKVFKVKDKSMLLYEMALRLKGVTFHGKPRYIDHNTYLDATYGLTLGDNIVISTDVIILTHDYSYTVGRIAIGKKPDTDIAFLGPVTVGDNCFIGAGAILLPGTEIGSNVIIGAGAVVKGIVENDSIVVGNPSKVIGNTREWAKKNEEHVQDLTLLVDRS